MSDLPDATARLTVRRVMRNSFVYVFASVASNLYVLLTIPLLSSRLAPEQWGLYTVFLQIGAMVQVLGVTAFSQAVLRQYGGAQEGERPAIVWSNIAGLTVVQTALVLVLYFAHGQILPHVFGNVGDGLDEVIGPACLWWHLAGVRSFLLTLTKSREEPAGVLGLTGLYGLLLLPGLYGVVALYGGGLREVLQVCAFAEAATVAVNLAMLAHTYRPRWAPATLKASLQFSWPLVPGALFTMLFLNLDRIVLSHSVGLKTQGDYALGAMVGSTMALVVTAFWSSYAPRTVALHRRDGAEEAARLSRHMLAQGYALLASAVMVFALLAWPLFHFGLGRGDAWAVSAVAIGVGVGHFGRFIVLQPQHGLYLSNRTRLYTLVNAMLAMICAGVAVTALDLGGAVALSFSTVTASLLLAFPLSRLVRPIYPHRWPADALRDALLAVVLVVGLALAAARTQGAVSGALYGAAALAMLAYLLRAGRRFRRSIVTDGVRSTETR